MADCAIPLISVIAPVYRAERFLADCVESILSQSFSNFELILVDDGSPDRSGAMCDAYSERDLRIQVIHKENGGVSLARNTGLEHAKGKFVVFVDSDDYLGENYLEDLYSAYQAAADSNVFVLSDYRPFSPDGEVARAFSGTFNASLCGQKNDAELFRRLVFDFLIFPPYCKLYRRDVIERNDLRFNQTLRSAEDFDFNCRYLRYMDEIVYIPSVQYNYRVDYKRYRPSNDGILGKSEITSVHIMAHGIQEIAERMGVLQEVQPEICHWAANKHYLNRLEMLFAPNKQIGFWARRRLYTELISDERYYDLAKRGAVQLPASNTKRIAQRADHFIVWWVFHRMRQRRGIRNRYQQNGA